jgi:hypothetical protein
MQQRVTVEHDHAVVQWRQIFVLVRERIDSQRAAIVRFPILIQIDNCCELTSRVRLHASAQRARVMQRCLCVKVHWECAAVALIHCEFQFRFFFAIFVLRCIFNVSRRSSFSFGYARLNSDVNMGSSVK